MISCQGAAPDEESLQKISLIDQSGLMQIISTKEELQQFQKIDFLTNQPYQFVTRIFLDTNGKKR